MTEAVLFDLDGTLVDSERHYTGGTKRWLEEIGIYKDIEEIYPIIGLTTDQTIDYLHRLTGLSKEEVSFRNEKYFLREHPIDYRDYLFPDVKDTLRQLKEKGIRMAICSGSEKFLIERFTENCGLDGYFDVLFSSEHYADKPDPSLYIAAMKELGLGPKDCLIVEDSRFGIEAGKRAGCRTLARDASRYHIQQEEADKIIKDLHEVLEEINERND